MRHPREFSDSFQLRGWKIENLKNQDSLSFPNLVNLKDLNSKKS